LEFTEEIKNKINKNKNEIILFIKQFETVLRNEKIIVGIISLIIGFKFCDELFNILYIDSDVYIKDWNDAKSLVLSKKNRFYLNILDFIAKIEKIIN
jgi:poly-beta-hydroxyalkanoate depolymerase